jgi:hypothetical protein
MRFPDEVLMAYADGELDPETRSQVQAAIATDPDVARRVAAHTALRASVRATFDRVLDEPIPERLIAAARASRAARPDSRIIPLHRKSTVRLPSWPQWGALAASFVLGAVVWQFGTRHAPAVLLERNGRVFASAALAQALSNQLASAQSPQSEVQIGVSFRSKSGQYCRTFQLRDENVLSGLACRADEQWQLEVVVPGARSPRGPSTYRQAASALPAAVIQAVNDSISGEPLDAQAEAAARAKQWQAR